MGAKLWAPEMKAIKLTYDFAVHGGAVGTIALGNLPDNFVVTKAICHVETALVGGGSFVLGEDGGGDADGYWTDLDAASVDTVVAATGALLFTSPVTAGEIGNEKAHLVAAAKDGVQVTIASTAYTAGKLNFHFIGFQA